VPCCSPSHTRIPYRLTMAAPAVDPKEPKLRTTLAPLPTTRRGYGIVLNASPKGDKIIYTNGRTVVVRSLENPSESVLFCEHKAAVSAAVFSPNGYWVASGDVEGNVIIWSFPQMKVKNTFQIAKTINDLDWDADGARIVAAGDGAQKARVFSWDSGNNLGEISMHSQPVISCSYRKVRPFRVATGSEDLSVNMYEGPPFKYKESYKGHSRYPNGVRYSPDGSKFVSVGADSKVVLYDGSTGAVLKESGSDAPNAHKGAIYAVSWSPDSKSLLTASADKTAKIWNAEDLSVDKTFTFGNDVLDQQVGALWAGEFLISVSLSGAINYLDVNNLAQPKRVLHGHQASIQSVAIDSKNGTFFTAGITGEIARWDFATGAAQWLTGKGHGGKVVSGLALSADGATLWSVGLDDKVRAHKTSGLVLSDEAGDLGGLPVSAAASPTDATLLAVVLAQEKLVLVRGAQVVSTLALGFTPTALTWSIDGSNLVVGGKDKKLRVYDLGKDAFTAQSKTIDTHDKPVTSLRFAPNGQALASTDMEASVYVHTWDSARALQNKSGWRFHQAAVKDVDWAPNGERLVTSSQDCHLIVWRDLKTFNGSERARAKDAHTDGALFVRWWDDKTLLSAGGDRAVKIWDVAE